jgi:ribosomal protein S18 acetylase RimI-like enzyme
MKVGVSEQFQRQGIARKLFNGLIEHLKKRGINKIMLEVDNQNIAAITLYQSLGFKKISTRIKYYKNGNDALIYSLII